MNINSSYAALVRRTKELVTVFLIGCVCVAHAQGPDLIVKDAWARPPLAPQNNTAVYMTIENPGATPKAIVGVSTMDAEKSGLHEMRMQGTMMTMLPVPEVTVPARGSVQLKPGGFHIMLFGVKKGVRAGDQLNLTLALKNGKTIHVMVMVREAQLDSSAPSSGQHSMPGRPQ